MKLHSILVAAALSVVQAASGNDLPSPSVDRVSTEGGVVQGVPDEGVLAYKGIPYAQAPVGALRWRAPQPVKAWTGVRDASRLGPDCMQAPLGPPPPGGRHEVAEDCLYLNIWRPTDAEKAPVMVWIHGGGFVNGGSSSPDSTGEAMAARGLVFVSFNYRLGRFGFFAFPALNDEHPAEAPGNYGLMDQIAALQWVRRNIADFGGDPRNVTVGPDPWRKRAWTSRGAPTPGADHMANAGRSGSVNYRVGPALLPLPASPEVCSCTASSRPLSLASCWPAQRAPACRAAIRCRSM